MDTINKSEHEISSPDDEGWSTVNYASKSEENKTDASLRLLARILTEKQLKPTSDNLNKEVKLMEPDDFWNVSDVIKIKGANYIKDILKNFINNKSKEKRI